MLDVHFLKSLVLCNIAIASTAYDYRPSHGWEVWPANSTQGTPDESPVSPSFRGVLDPRDPNSISWFIQPDYISGRHRWRSSSDIYASTTDSIGSSVPLLTRNRRDAPAGALSESK